MQKIQKIIDKRGKQWMDLSQKGVERADPVAVLKNIHYRKGCLSRLFHLKPPNKHIQNVNTLLAYL